MLLVSRYFAANSWMSSEMRQKDERARSRKLSTPPLTAKHCWVRFTKGVRLEAASLSSTSSTVCRSFAKAGCSVFARTCTFSGTIHDAV